MSDAIWKINPGQQLAIQRDAYLNDIFIWVKRDGHIIGSMSPPLLKSLGIELAPGEEKAISLVVHDDTP